MEISVTLTDTTTMTEKGSVKLTLHTEATGISEKVFAIEVLPRGMDRLNPIFRFSHVCSPAELQEFPDEAPGDNCYFRVNDITMIFDTPINASLLLQHVKEDIKKLVDECRRLDEAGVTENTTTF